MTTISKILLLALVSVAIMLNSCQQKPKKQEMTANKIEFGKLPDGRTVYLYTLKNRAGMEVKISDFGGIIVSWTAPNKDLKYEDITLGCDELSCYQKGVPYFGAIVGRYGNRIANGSFKLNDKVYS